ncbi:2,4-dienoyl-CoA reductase or related NADH-dependent reductase, Old Yellow Enzyme (OYE) family [Geosmithia morbida]|uniref:2,4-dienoyl-CoA reductase or related NADH-dependent reductase, Old Yellow Enzyme (OYE) family n=1 Tax=Geosmithia morbida TaxID=1094350 RepID=A0A9P4YXD8_9HYPO|nr:2,4-dienoyl-CoA reductase or related NADH-dependent reductase, Old Yellow Enzyme (OYE) family [Geosmithia morbida]KAF4124836.1 2,4-dienoyl-CoA reductase or related NADH-dependent reductase, Old Yellow Enzyme (OYE) family [Geosmithia morbida]
MTRDIENKAAPGIPYFTPFQDPPAGTPHDAASAPTLFQPLRIRGVELHNRWGVAPMCTYSAGQDGRLTDWHLVHLGQYALHGAGLVIAEATAVEPRGRISPHDSGLWDDEQIAPLRRITDYIHGQGSHAAIQLAHGGRKASSLPPWIRLPGSIVAPEHLGGWPDHVVGPSGLRFDEDHVVPHELTSAQIGDVVQKFRDAAARAVKAGFDVIEVHGAHGYLISSFLSPTSNKRNDEYGGSFENRTRLLREVLTAIRGVIPANMPLWLRISATEWMDHSGEPSWDLQSSIRLARQLPALGVDVLDVSSGGNSAAQKFTVSQTYQTDLAGEIRRSLHAEGIFNLLIATVGQVRDGRFAASLVQTGGEEPQADLVLAGRQFLREADFVLSAAQELDVPVQWPSQYLRAAPKVNRPNL